MDVKEQLKELGQPQLLITYMAPSEWKFDFYEGGEGVIGAVGTNALPALERAIKAMATNDPDFREAAYNLALQALQGTR